MECRTLKELNTPSNDNKIVSYHIEGSLIPAITLEITEKQSLIFEHHLISWKTPSLNITTSQNNLHFKRGFGGMPIILLEASGEGKISLSRHSTGNIFPMHLKPGEVLDVREHQYVAATSNLEYTFKHISPVLNVMFGGTGFFIDQFKATGSEGIVWLHSYGDLFEITLKQDEQIDIDSGSFVYKDTTVSMENIKNCFSFGWMGTKEIVHKRFTGPGRIGIQTASLTMALDSKEITRGKKGLIGFIFGLLARANAK